MSMKLRWCSCCFKFKLLIIGLDEPYEFDEDDELEIMPVACIDLDELDAPTPNVDDCEPCKDEHSLFSIVSKSNGLSGSDIDDSESKFSYKSNKYDLAKTFAPPLSSESALDWLVLFCSKYSNCLST